MIGLKNRAMWAILILMLGSTGCGSGGADGVNQPAVTVATPAPSKPPLLSNKVATAANSWVEGNPQATENVIQPEGIRNWRHSADKIVTYVRVGQTGALELALNGKVWSGVSIIEVSVNGVTQKVEMSNTNLAQVYVGQFNVVQSGYQKIVLQGISASAEVFADIDDIMIGGSAVGGDTFYIKDDYYWGRRGPSVHLSYPSPTQEPIEYFYSELMVPAGQDVVGSYYMANGFGQGYFGIQVNSTTERRVLFSVWSPYETDDPSKIPPEDRVVLQRKGPEVQTGEFGNEGSGGQSFLVYPWQAGQSYKFLLKVTPSEQNHTDYSAWFYAPEQAQWRLIASFRRPKTQTWLTNQHSFLENFIPAAGQFSREALYGNGWVRTAAGTWLPLQQASFSYDDTARRQSRWDYQGGVKNGWFYLKNGGFFHDFTTFGRQFEREVTMMPVVDVTTLP